MRSYKMIVAYDGTDFRGWQKHPRQRTVQQELENAVHKVTTDCTKVVGSSRTDAGVHALGQVVGFKSTTQLPERVILRALRAEIPDDIEILHVEQVPDDFHAIRSAITKRYRYILQDGPMIDVFGRSSSWHLYEKLNVESMREASRALLGEHDFIAYESSGSARVSTVRTVYDIQIERQSGAYTDKICVEIEANGFLYNMVRVIVGTLAQVGRGKYGIHWPLDVLLSRDRVQAGPTAPACGLFLLWVNYDRLPTLPQFQNKLS